MKINFDSIINNSLRLINKTQSIWHLATVTPKCLSVKVGIRLNWGTYELLYVTKKGHVYKDTWFVERLTTGYFM